MNREELIRDIIDVVSDSVIAEVGNCDVLSDDQVTEVRRIANRVRRDLNQQVSIQIKEMGNVEETEQD